MERICLSHRAGNPGLADFYIPFLGDIHAQLQSNATVIAHGLLGHVPAIDNSRLGHSSEDSLRVQVTGTIEILRSIKDYYGSDTKVILISHSIGTWISLQVCGFFRHRCPQPDSV